MKVVKPIRRWDMGIYQDAWTVLDNSAVARRNCLMPFK